MARDYSILHSLHGSVPESAIATFQLVLNYIYDLNDQVQRLPKGSQKTSIEEIEAQIQSRKQINLSQFLGTLAQPQNAAIPSVSALPDVNDPLAQDGGAVRFNGVLYIFNATTEPGTWVAITAAGVIRNTAANMATYSAAAYPNVLFYQTDRTVFYLSDGTNWIYAIGTYRATLASIPTLGVNDIWFNFFVTDYYHTLRWNGTAWIWGDGELGSGYYTLFETTPGQATGWQICDGSTVDRLNGDGTKTSVTLEDYTTPAYLKGGVASAVIAAATGTVANTTPTNNAAATGISIDAHTSTTELLAAGATVVLTGPASHTVTDPTHNHTQNAHNHAPGTLELRQATKRLYYRR